MNKINKKLTALLHLPFLFVAAVVILSSCVNEDTFLKSDRNTPTEIRFKNQIGSRIKLGNGTVASPDTAFVQLPEEENLNNLSIDFIAVPSLTQIVPDFKGITDFTNPVTFTLTSESGTNVRSLVVVAEYGKFELQLPYYQMNQWYEMGQFKNGDGYFNIGEVGASTPWANTNDVAAILDKAACIPSNFPQPSGHVVLTTLMNPTGGTTVGSGIASANIFTGNFRSNPNHFLDRDKQRDNCDFGIPYRKRPISVTFEFKYKPGTQVERWERKTQGVGWEGRDLYETDSMEVWIVLHKRIYDESTPNQTRFIRVASGGYISSETVNDWRRITIPIHYGKPDQAFLNAHPEAYRQRDIGLISSPRFVYQHNALQNPTDPSKWTYSLYRINEEWSVNPETEDITHLSLSFNSSANGWNYQGAGERTDGTRQGSKLEIRNIIFEEDSSEN